MKKYWRVYEASIQFKQLLINSGFIPKNLVVMSLYNTFEFSISFDTPPFLYIQTTNYSFVRSQALFSVLSWTDPEYFLV